MNAFYQARQFADSQDDRQRMLQQEQNAMGMANTAGKIENAFMQGNPQQAGALAQSSGDAGLMQGAQQRQQGIQQAGDERQGQMYERIGQIANGMRTVPVAQRGAALRSVAPELFSFGATPEMLAQWEAALSDPTQSDAALEAISSRVNRPQDVFGASAPRMQGANDVPLTYQGGVATQGAPNPMGVANQRIAQQNANTAQQRANTPRGPLVSVNTGEAQSDPFGATLAEAEANMFADFIQIGQSAQRNLVQVDRLESLMTNVDGGMGTAIQSLAGSFGINSEGLSDIQAADALISAMVPAQRPPGSGPMSDADLDLFKRSLPRLINAREGNAIIIQTLRGINEYDYQLGQIAQAAAAGQMNRAQAREAVNALHNPLARFRSEAGAAPRTRRYNPETGQIEEQ